MIGMSTKMKVKELIELLKNCDLEEVVILFNDAKDDQYSPLDDLSRDIYRPRNRALISYSHNRAEGDIDVVTLWPEGDNENE